MSINLSGQELVDNHKLLTIDGKLYLDSLYKDSKSKLIIEKVIKIEGKSVSEIKNLVKEWGALKSRGLKNILTTETENLVSFNVSLDNGPMGHSWTYKFDFQIREGRFKFQVYDIGNATPLASMLPINSINMDFFFSDGYIKAKYKVRTFLKTIDDLYRQFTSLEEYLKNPILGNNSKQNDW
jgi:hypothetical protein